MDTMVRHAGSSAATISLAERQHGRARNTHQVVAGALLSITGIGMILSIITNEALYPLARHYSTFANAISDLGGTEPPNSYMVEPNRLIFIITMAVSGVLVLAATYLLWRVVERRRFLVALGIFGVGIIGIAVFPGNVATYHPLFSFVCFVGGSVAAILSRRVLEAPLRYFAVALGSIALLATVSGLEALEDWGPQAAIGIGGVERWIAYPVLLWLVLLGAAFMTRGSTHRIEE
jgi:hypothetical membrane protein